MPIKLKYDADTSAIKSEIYPLIETSMNKSSTKSAYKKLVNDFISFRTESLYDTVPCDRIICNDLEMDKLFKVLKIDKNKFKQAIDNTYYGKIDHFSPLAAKHEFTIAMLSIIRYFLLNNQKKECELALIHLAFSGKFYPSIHSNSYKVFTPKRHIMEYVVNNKLSKKFDIVSQGNVIGAVRSICLTWLNTYNDRFKSFNDEDIVYLIDQLRSRIASFMKNIADEYFTTYYNGEDEYITYSSDSYDSDDFHLADNNSLKLSSAIEKTINHINTYGVEYKTCNMCSNTDITPNECKAVIESIISNKENIVTIKELVSLMISLYYATGERDVSDIRFITYSIAPKPNAKQKEIIRMKEIIEQWLEESGTAYMRRRSRIATKNSYERAVRMYFALTIHNSNR